jgi:hypothetical protein
MAIDRVPEAENTLGLHGRGGAPSAGAASVDCVAGPASAPGFHCHTCWRCQAVPGRSPLEAAAWEGRVAATGRPLGASASTR